MSTGILSIPETDTVRHLELGDRFLCKGTGYTILGCAQNIGDLMARKRFVADNRKHIQLDRRVQYAGLPIAAG